MSAELLTMVVVLVLAIVMGFPIGLALFGSGLFYFLITGLDPSRAGEIVLHNLFASFVLLAVPLFIFAAQLMNAGGISDRLLQLALALVGRFRGGLAQVNVLASLIFASMSGSATADAAGIGRVLIGMMVDKERYPPGFAAAVTAASATIGPIFPPSIIMVLYALVSSTSVGALFLAGIAPGILMTIALMIAVAIIAARRKYPVEPAMAAAAILAVVLRALLPLLMPVLLLGGIYTGAFTPTEAAAIAGLYALILSAIVYRQLGLRQLFIAIRETAQTTTMITTVYCGAVVMSYILTFERLPRLVAELLQDSDLSKFQFLLIVNVILLVLGAFMEATAVMLVVAPLLTPTIVALGIDPVHFGIVVTLNLTIGLITPPYGMILFVIAGVNRIPVSQILREISPFIAVLIMALLIVTYVPAISLFLPKLFGFVRG
jgi:tripartite ATP-independent transporter DctM subunit